MQRRDFFKIAGVAGASSQQLKVAYRNFVEEAEPERKNEAGRDLIRAIFGKNSIAEDSIF